MSSHKSSAYKWLATGDETFPALFDAIESARKTIRFETYIYASDNLGHRFREALVQAQRRGVKVLALVDAVGSLTLSTHFWQPLVSAGGEMRWFNPVSLKRLGFRNHRKMLICDDTVAFVGGFNITDQYVGDGVKSGWCDLGLRVISPLAVELAAAFDEMFARADFQHKTFTRLRRSPARRNIATHHADLLLSGPGRGRNPYTRALREDLAHAKTVQIIAAYFLPNRRLRRALMGVARRGGRVQLILPGKTDVLLSQLACRSLYRRFLRAGVEIYEYQPQILHAKLVVIDGIVYAGSSNMDPRSFYINYELMLRIKDKKFVDEGKEIFHRTLGHCRRIELEQWRKSRNWLDRLEQRWAYFLLVRVDPYIARRQFRRMPN